MHERHDAGHGGRQQADDAKREQRDGHELGLAGADIGDPQPGRRGFDQLVDEQSREQGRQQMQEQDEQQGRAGEQPRDDLDGGPDVIAR